ncbi:RagB/SusD family nutrient uptake outer membrane protein [Moheibacter lacus]|uniref:RagB/SusD family nutrient uptake outer membrane protein n=1 Tax=Moheibacter lacus TaxID=2745851 RepID=A0A838ZGP3_9FLAO|nr:RagB/SusD family nutrient uptake outer membrane protein [Moheibacter lacus]MBA5628871.1 RagB/SusD family nutrient uptake outer membrane protein [Moheibacter lacus]
MKKYIKYAFLSSMAFFLSCEDEDIQNQSPGSAVYEGYYTSLPEFEAAVNGAYNSFFGSGLYSDENGIIKVGDVLSDNVIQDPLGRGTMTIGHNWTYNSGTGGASGIYGTGYQMASRANAILDNEANLIDSLLTPADLLKKQQLMAEARALRAIGHFEIAKVYTKIPTQSADANSFAGIAYVDTFDPYATPGRLATVADVYNRIAEDFEAAYVDIPATSANLFRLNKTSLAGIMSRFYLYMGRYDKVIEYATPVVAVNDPCAGDDLLSFWRSVHSDGVLFQTLVDASDPAIGINYSQGTGPNTLSEYNADKAFYDTFLPTEGDRLNASIQFIASKNIYAVRKYMQSNLGTVNLHYGRYLRVEEVILNLAEAQYLSGNQGGALTTLNILRDERYTSYAGGESGDALFNAIINERRKELAFEGDRFFTLKRLMGVPGIPSQYAQGIVRSGNGHFADGTGNPSPSQVLTSDAREWQWPLTQSILIYNPNMTQTPGYEQ